MSPHQPWGPLEIPRMFRGDGMRSLLVAARTADFCFNHVVKLSGSMDYPVETSGHSFSQWKLMEINSLVIDH